MISLKLIPLKAYSPIESIVDGRIIEGSLQKENAFLPMELIPSCRFIEVSPAPLKVFVKISVIPSGSLMEVNDLQPPKALPPKYSRFSGRLISDRFEQLRKAEGAIFFNVSGRFIFCIVDDVLPKSVPTISTE